MMEDWVECELGEICEFIGGGTPSKRNAEFWNGKIPWASIKDIKGDDLTTTQDFITEEGLINSSANIAEIDELILATRITPGKPILSKIRTAINQDLKVVKPKISYETEYLFFLLKNLTPKILKLSSGTTVLGINLTNLRSIKIFLPPLPIQRAIVAKIETLFSSLDSGIADLKKAQAQLKIYRQAVLKKAFEGELTKAWREQQTDLPTAEALLEQIKEERQKHYDEQLATWKKAVEVWEENGKEGKKPSRISKPKTQPEIIQEDIQNYEKLPQRWVWSRFGNVTYKIGDIDHKMPKTVENGLPYLSTGNIKADGTIEIDRAKTISKADFERLALKIKPEKGDIIFPRYGTIGRNVLVKTDRKFLVSYSCAIIKNIRKLMEPKFALYYSISPVIKKEIRRYTVQTTQANIGIASIESFVFPLCPKAEQHQIVQEIESRLSVCDKVEENIETSLKKAEALRQSILKKAFEGKLLTRAEIKKCKAEADYEPASVLLERIKEEKSKNKSKK